VPRKKSLNDEQVQDACVLARMMGDPFRFRALMLIARRGPISVTEICTTLDARQPTASYHLGLLKRSKLVNTQRNGKQIMYRLSDSFLRGEGCAGLLLLHATAAGKG